MNILSLFDGCCLAYQALQNLGIKVNRYYSSEVDKYAIKIALKNHPDIIFLGDINKFSADDFMHDEIDLVIGGSPCQDLSIAKNNRQGLDGKRSGLFWKYVELLEGINPKYFLLENVASMSKENKQIITDRLGVKPIMINSALLTAQNRKRLYWTNIPGITQPEDKGIMLQDILIDGIALKDKSLCVAGGYAKLNYQIKRKRKGMLVKIGILGDKDCQSNRVYSVGGKSVSLSANGGGLGAKTGLYLDKDMVRKLHPVECERLQGLPDNYTEGVSNTQRYKMIGNGFTVPVIEHILSFIR